MAFDIQFKLIYQGIRDVFRVRSLSYIYSIGELPDKRKAQSAACVSNSLSQMDTSGCFSDGDASHGSAVPVRASVPVASRRVG